jgi:ferredoxin
LQRLLDALRGRDFRVLGPTVRDGSCVLDEISTVEDLPIGQRDTQSAGAYSLAHHGDERVFGVVNGPSGLKPLVFTARESLIQVEMHPEERSFTARPTLPEPARVAVLGVRACDLAALAVQDRVFLHDRYPDPYYAVRRSGLFLVAVNCTRSVSTCFCTSMETGPEAREGFDLALTEFDEGFLVRSGSAAGREILDVLELPEARAEVLLQERRDLEACADEMERRFDTSDLPGLLYENLEHSRFEDAATRCLSCGNCTMVCPTCFCHNERDDPTLDGRGSVRVREWDSCFDYEHAQVHGMNHRPRTRDRYRQWLVHKFASWIEQFGTSGCTGCGRCITWCPVGIDPTEEIDAIRRTRR